MDNAVMIRRAREQTASGPVRVSFAAALTLGQEGKTLSDAAALREAGAAVLSDDGRHAMSPALLERGLQQAALVGLPVFVHARYENGTADAEARATEDAITALSRVRGARLHVQHVSTAAAVQSIRAAKAAGLAVTAEVTPHHLRLTAKDAATLGPTGTVNPPLAAATDREAVLTALLEGTIDAVATDHAPHDARSKLNGAPGFSGFETALGVLLDLRLPWEVIHRACVRRPAEILGAGHVDDWVLIDPKHAWQVDPEKFVSLGRNTPFGGRRFRGSILMTICRGAVVRAQAVPVG
jgi:dihydroorotase